MTKNRVTWLSVLLVGAMFLLGCGPLSLTTTPDVPAAPTAGAGLPNPASAYCVEQGGRLEIRTDESGGQYGVCVFDDGSECEEWAFFRDECSPGTTAGMPNPASAYCEEQGGTLQIRTDATGGQYGVCVFGDGSECEEWAFFRGECSPGAVQPDVVYEGISFSYDDSLAAQVTGETVPASGQEGDPLWAIEPLHVRFSFGGYVLPDTFHEPRILVYPVAELSGDEAAALQQFLAQRPAAPDTIPFMPHFNAGQMLRSQVAYIDFGNGSGVRFLTHYSQAAMPVNNNELFYTFQGLTADGRYYVAAVLPVSHPSLPANGNDVPGGDWEAFAQNYENYVRQVEAQLDAEDGASFVPSLFLLDGMIRSLNVTPTSLP